MTQDEDQLKLLSVFHYVVGGIAGLVAMFPIVHVVIGLMFLIRPQEFEGQNGPPPVLIGLMFVIIPAVFILAGWILAAFVIAAGRSLAKRKHYKFCLVVAGVECIFMPLGTILDVLTIIVLMRESTKQLFTADESL